MKNYLLLSTLFLSVQLSAQTKAEKGPSHYMPLYLDMPAELNADKGFKEFNIGIGFNNYTDVKEKRVLVEYSFVPIKKLAFEIEMPFIFRTDQIINPSTHENNMAVRAGVNYMFYGNSEKKLSFSTGYFYEGESATYEHFGKPLIEAHIHNPFVVAAKQWGKRIHSMIYTGPVFEKITSTGHNVTLYRLNSILGYSIGKEPGETYVAIECNQVFEKDYREQFVIHPQVSFKIAPHWKAGIVAGIPVVTSSHLRNNGLIRLIYNPGE